MYICRIGGSPLAGVKGRGPIQRDRATPNYEGAMLMQTMEDSNLRQLWRLADQNQERGSEPKRC